MISDLMISDLQDCLKEERSEIDTLQIGDLVTNAAGRKLLAKHKDCDYQTHFQSL